MKKSNIFTFITGFLSGTVLSFILVFAWFKLQEHTLEQKIDYLENSAKHDKMMIDAYDRTLNQKSGKSE